MNTFYTGQKKQLKQLKVTRRIDINVGFSCNLRCSFCYYLENIKTGKTHDLSTDEIKQRLRVGRKFNKTAVDFTGGEPTLRQDLEEIIKYATQIGYKDICIITNGFIVGKKGKPYLNQLLNAGLNDILMSLHGPDAKTHDQQTNYEGSFNQMIKAIEVVKNCNLRLRFNLVVNQSNFMFTSKTFSLMAQFKPHAINLIFFQPSRDAVNASAEVKFHNYQDATDQIRNLIDQYRSVIPSINIRDLPFCLMKGYEPHIKTMQQLQYEKVEWDYFLDVKFKKKWWFLYGATLLGAILLVANPRFLHTNFECKYHDALQRSRILLSRKKGKVCKQCALRLICDGLPTQYFNINGDAELSPYPGDLILNPIHFFPHGEAET